MVFGVVDSQMNRGNRILTIQEMLVLHEAGGKMKRFMLYSDTYTWVHRHVLLSEPEAAVLLKVIRWYEETLLTQHDEITKNLGEKDLITRYEKLTQITRALQTAPTAGSDHYDL